MKQGNDSQQRIDVTRDDELSRAPVKSDSGVVEVIAKRVGSLVGFMLKHSTFEFGFCTVSCAPILYLVHPPLGLVALAMGVGATAGKLGKLLDKRTNG